MPMVNELMGFDWNFSLMDYGMAIHVRIYLSNVKHMFLTRRTMV